MDEDLYLKHRGCTDSYPYRHLALVEARRRFLHCHLFCGIEAVYSLCLSDLVSWQVDALGGGVRPYPIPHQRLAALQGA